VNLENLLYDYNPTADMALQPFDRIIIPTLRFSVSVLGDVDKPGIYYYVPQKTYSYYLSLAGGIPPIETADYIAVLDENDRPRSLDEVIQPEDRIIITSSLISVAGAVYDPGSYPYVPGKDFEYYVRLAGGIDPELNNDGKVLISGPNGNTIDPGTAIEPGDRIFVETNDFAYNFNRYFPIIATGITFITTIISIVDLLADINRE
jgi:protein involved in polysaccharide export with SLBB domain